MTATHVAWTTTVHKLLPGQDATVCGHPVPSTLKALPIGYWEDYSGKVCRNCERKAHSTKGQ